jgi:hypothetical protein
VKVTASAFSDLSGSLELAVEVHGEKVVDQLGNAVIVYVVLHLFVILRKSVASVLSQRVGFLVKPLSFTAYLTFSSLGYTTM